MRMSPFAPRGRALFPGKHKLDITVFGAPVTLMIEAKDAFESAFSVFFGECCTDALMADAEA